MMRTLLHGTDRRRRRSRVLVTLLAVGLSGLGAGAAYAADLQPGDVIVADFGPTSGDTGSIIRVDRVTGDQEVLYAGAPLVDPVSVVVDPFTGDLLISDDGAEAVFRLDLAGPSISILTEPLESPRHMALEADGSLLVCDAVTNAVIRIDLATGVGTPIPGGDVIYDWCEGIGVSPDGTILTTDRNQGKLVTIDPDTNDHTELEPGGAFDTPIGLDVEDVDHVILVDTVTDELYRVDLPMNSRSVVSMGQNFVTPRGVWIEEDGRILVMDRDSGLIRVDPTQPSGTNQTVVSQDDFFEAPLGIFVVQSVCSDGVDNDGDGTVDWPEDEGCIGAAGASEQARLLVQVPLGPWVAPLLILALGVSGSRVASHRRRS